ncbi:uncharacterized protein FA14DRAFT_156534 [Meira miltonrushii]|uniref:Uncharacterized protein n=1 Tax=Meira miltonrushii TaxID=1280837 RepID=A0A316VEF4_9BASI|nr:uncharacterized protein FA14DRAFT_156534 [Meira miltonrushii]PWN33855.1 hypothetical protein FA14DRAFT_156534 [Meira miltonrushii]
MASVPLVNGQLPAWSLQNNAGMIEFIKSISLKSIPMNLKRQNDFYIAFKCILLAAGLTLLIRLIMTGRFWLMRVVRTPKGFLICPNACEALCLSACVFYLIDLFFRGFSINWLWGDSLSMQEGMPLLYSFRLYFLWLAGFIHLASTLLIWPFDPMRIRPFYWHLFLFGVPIAFLIGFLPNCIRAEVYNRMANQRLVPLLITLQGRDPEGPLDANSIAIATDGYEHVVLMWQASRDYAAVALAFLILLTFGSIATGYQITSRAARRYRDIKRAATQVRNETPIEEGETEGKPTYSSDSQHSEDKLTKQTDNSPYLLQTISSQPTNEGAMNKTDSTIATQTAPSRLVTNEDKLDFKVNPITEPKMNQTKNDNDSAGLRRIEVPKRIEWRKFSHLRLLRYFAGLDPLPAQNSESDLALARYGKPSQESVEAVLKDFLYFSLVQFSCLIIIELVMAACAFLIILTIIPDLRSPAYVPQYTTKFALTAYIFFVLEIWVIVSIGSPLILIMLWRQLYPIRVDFGNDIYTRQAPTLKIKNVAKLKNFRLKKKNKDGAEKDEMEAEEVGNDTGDWHHVPWTPSTRATFMPTSPSSVSTKANKEIQRSAGANNISISRTTPSLDGSIHGAEEEEYERDNRWSKHYSNDGIELEDNRRKTKESITRDVCGLAGSDMGVRRIVLDALESSNKYPTRKLGGATTSVWQRAEAAHLHERRPSLPSKASESQMQKIRGQQPQRGGRRNSQADLTTPPSSKSNSPPPMLSRLHGSLRKNSSFSQKDTFGIPMSKYQTNLQPPENARFVTPHGFVQSRPYE